MDKYAQPVAKMTVVHRLRPFQTKNNSTIHEETVEKISRSDIGCRGGSVTLPVIFGTKITFLPGNLVISGGRVTDPPLQWRMNIEKFHNS